MPQKDLASPFRELLQGRYIATIATQNANRSIHLAAVWYLFEGDAFYIATSSRSQKARNARSHTTASVMVDSRHAGKERGVTAQGKIEIISGEQSKHLNQRVHARYLSPAALNDPGIGPVLSSFDDITLKLTPESWFSWDMAQLDQQAFAGRLGSTPGYLHPLD